MSEDTLETKEDKINRLFDMGVEYASQCLERMYTENNREEMTPHEMAGMLVTIFAVGYHKGSKGAMDDVIAFAKTTALEELEVIKKEEAAALNNSAAEEEEEQS